MGSGSEGSSWSADPLGLVLAAAEPKHGPALLSLFERTSTPCHCQYWHFTGDKNEWLERLFHAPELNRAAFLENLAQPGLKGIVALRGEQAVGWMKLCLAESIPKLYAQRLYKGLPCFNGPRDGVLTVGCFLIDEDVRRQGVARALVRHAVRVAEQTGARAVEAFPRRSDQAGPAELWTGPSTLFLEEGFEIINDFGPYPVLRHALPASRA
ncbi:MAG: GNAT family N-acetyltransferase [Polyangiaceae bacterium]